MRIIRACLAAAAMVWAACGASLAQSTPLIIDQQRPDRHLASKPQNPVPAPAVPGSSAAPLIAPFVLKTVEISGASLSTDRLTAATKPFIGQTIDTAALEKITDAVAAAYTHSKIAFYSVVAPTQDFADGVLKLTVLEGYIEHVDIQGDVTGDLSLVETYASKMTLERPLTRATWQRYLSLIRDVAGLTVDVQLLRGDAPGATRLVLKLTQKKVKLGLSVNNGGSAYLGRTQIEGDATFYDATREGEQQNLTLEVPTDVRQFQYVAAGAVEPIGAEGTTALLNLGYLHTQPKGTTLTGEAESMQFAVNHPLLRDFEQSLYATADFDGLNSSNALIGQTTTSERVRALRFSGVYALAKTDDFVSLSAALSLGINGLGARVASPLTAVSDFHKLDLQAAFDRLLVPHWIVRLRAGGQLAGERLPNSELYALGGPDFGRAFPAATIVGDQGLAGSAELAWRPESLPLDFLKTGSEVFAYLDGGEARQLRRGPFVGREFDLASAGTGVRLAVFEHSSLELQLSRQLDVPSALGLRRSWELEFAIRTQS